MSTKVAFITEPLFEDNFTDEIVELERCLQEYKESQPAYFHYSKHKHLGYVYFCGISKDTAPNFESWESIGSHIQVKNSDGSYRALRMSFIGNDDVRGDENNLSGQ